MYNLVYLLCFATDVVNKSHICMYVCTYIYALHVYVYIYEHISLDIVCSCM